MRKSDWWTVVRPHSRELEIGAYDRATAKAQQTRNQVRTSPSPTQTPMALAFEPVGCPDGSSQRSPPEPTTTQSCMSKRKVSAGTGKTGRRRREDRGWKGRERRRETEEGEEGDRLGREACWGGR